MGQESTKSIDISVFPPQSRNITHEIKDEVILVSSCSFPTRSSCRAGLPSTHTQTQQLSQMEPDSLLCFGFHLEENDLLHDSCLGLGCLALQSFRIVLSIGSEGAVVIGRMLTSRAAQEEAPRAGVVFW